MARKVVHQLIDDIDGTQLEIGDGSTVHFSLDGKTYEIDLSAENAQALTDALAPYVSVARRAGAAQHPPARKASRTDLNAVREWAQSQGITVSPRGRVAQSVLDAYDAR